MCGVLDVRTSTMGCSCRNVSLLDRLREPRACTFATLSFTSLAQRSGQKNTFVRPTSTFFICSSRSIVAFKIRNGNLAFANHIISIERHDPSDASSPITEVNSLCSHIDRLILALPNLGFNSFRLNAYWQQLFFFYDWCVPVNKRLNLENGCVWKMAVCVNCHGFSGVSRSTS